MTGLRVVTHSAEGTRALGYALAELCEPGDLVVLAGGLGGGKTTFVRGLAAGLGVPETVVSPTFVLAREYHGRLPLVHADVYRLERTAELDELGLFETDDAVVAVEWGSAVDASLPAERLEVSLDHPEAPGSDDDRVVTLVLRGPSWTTRRGALDLAVGTPGGLWERGV